MINVIALLLIILFSYTGDSSSEDEEGLPEGFMSGGVGRPHAGGRMMPGAEHRQHQQPYPLFGGHGNAEDGSAVVFSANPLPAAMNVSMQYPVQPAQVKIYNVFSYHA